MGSGERERADTVDRGQTLATIRIYKVAEVLGIPSQEVIDLLARAHGIEVKSASSTIEEIVAREFAKRIARERDLNLPAGRLFSSTSALPGRKGARGAKVPEPAPRPRLGPPRLVKSPRAAPPPATVAEESQPSSAAIPAPAVSPPPVRTPFAEGRPQLRVPGATGTPPAPVPPAAAAPATAAATRPAETLAPARRPGTITVEPAARTAPPPAEPTVPAAPAQPATSAATAAPAEPATSTAAPAEPATSTAAPAEPAAPAAPAAAVEPAAPPAPAAPAEPAAPAAPTAPVVPAAPAVPDTPAAAAPAASATPVEPAAPPAEPPPVKKPPTRAPQPAAAKPAPGPPISVGVKPTGRLVPSTMRLRIEEQAPPLVPKTISRRPPKAPPGPTRRPGPPLAARPPGPTRPRPGSRPIAPAPTRPSAPLGGPRPLPSQPVRAPGARPAAPAVGYRPAYRPPPRPPGGRKRRPPRPSTPFTPAPPPPITRTISLAEGMTVKDLAEKLDLRAKDVLKKLIERRLMMTINTTLDTETATMVAREFGADVEMRSFEEEMLEIESTDTQEEDLSTRAPVITVMGHVDHGKTTLLDAIRNSRVAEREAGGITQHIGAYAVEVNKRRIVFLDTPGHEAFTLMRARGARVTDIVILVVAADDGVMPQTKEAIDHAKAADVPLIVAINKIDKANANPDRVKTELSELGLTAEDWGGSTVTVAVSAKKQENLDLLLEMILLVTDLGELKANPKRSASGTVLEAKIDRGRGPVATILVKDGTLRIGDNFIAGPIVGKVRALIDDRGQPQKEAGPSSPIEVLGLTGLPQPGDTFQAVADAAKARQIALLRQGQAKEKTLGEKGGRLTLESLQQQIAEGGTRELPIIVKADVQGSAEVLADSLNKLGDERVKVRLLSSGAGAVNEGDVVFAAASNAVIIGFNVRPDRNAAAMAEREHIDIRLHRVIYDVTDEIKKAMAGLLDPTVKEVQVGQAQVRDVFKVPKFGAAAGCLVVEGKISRSGETQARLLRDNVVIHEGRIGSLRRFKDDVNEVKNGLECGIAFERYADIKVGDVIEVFSTETIAATV